MIKYEARGLAQSLPHGARQACVLWESRGRAATGRRGRRYSGGFRHRRSLGKRRRIKPKIANVKRRRVYWLVYIAVSRPKRDALLYWFVGAKAQLEASVARLLKRRCL
eukprot:scaffold52257_cov31-Tisochrysis_lutea.AAC.3